MRKTITLPDGTVEVLEGTPEEIAAHEKLIRERVSKEPGKKKPDVLKGAEIKVTGDEPVKLDPELIKKLQELIDATRDNKPVRPWYELLPQTLPTCWYCGKQGCTELHQHPYGSPFIYGTFSATSDRTYLVGDSADQIGIIKNLH